jgi:hypothetical protein
VNFLRDSLPPHHDLALLSAVIPLLLARGGPGALRERSTVRAGTPAGASSCPRLTCDERGPHRSPRGVLFAINMLLNTPAAPPTPTTRSSAGLSAAACARARCSPPPTTMSALWRAPALSVGPAGPASGRSPGRDAPGPRLARLARQDPDADASEPHRAQRQRPGAGGRTALERSLEPARAAGMGLSRSVPGERIWSMKRSTSRSRFLLAGLAGCTTARAPAEAETPADVDLRADETEDVTEEAEPAVDEVEKGATGAAAMEAEQPRATRSPPRPRPTSAPQPRARSPAPTCWRSAQRSPTGCAWSSDKKCVEQ